MFISFVIIVFIFLALISGLFLQTKENGKKKLELKNLKIKLLSFYNELNEYKLKDESSSKKIMSLEQLISEKDKLYENLSQINNESLTHLSIIYADHLTLQFSLAEKYLSKSRSKVNIGKNIKIQELKELSKDHISRYKLMEYKYAYLLSIFPELELFTDSIDTLKELDLEFENNLEKIREEFDRTQFFLSKEEYSQLNEEQRNQLALDRYVKGKKSNWQIGRDYEMYIGYSYEKENYSVEYFGIENTLNDLGRDIIAKKDNVTKIVQCKYWSQEKQIREKHIAQLYGTTIQYILSNNFKEKNVIPVLVTNTRLSEKAKEFANFLNVEYIENKFIGEYPRIKCNTNKDLIGYDTKIYHLPFDQLYDRTKISRKGDFYAFTVKEAMENGFRRAKKYFGI